MPVGMGNLSCLRTLSMFVVVPKSGRGISELQGLDHLTGELKIKGLKHVRSSKDAKIANLLRKKNLRALSLFWSEKNNGTIEEEEEVASIGEAFQPHPDIKMLNLQYYNGLKFLSWMSHSCLPNLVKISLVGCKRCEHLSPLRQLPLLEVLKISGMDSVKCIGDEFYGDHHPQGSFFPSLKSLSNMPNLEEWYSTSSKEEVFTSLESLNLKGCSKLRSLPRLSSSLKKLQLTSSNEMILERSLESLPPYLSTLEIGGYNHEFLHERRWAMILQKFACLQSLKISYRDKIKTLPKVLLENLPTTLTELYIWACKEMISLPGVMQTLTSLKPFDIYTCRSLKYLPELGSRNTALTNLLIQNCVGLTSVSDCLRHLTALEGLHIYGCPELEFLPGDFQDLREIHENVTINNCHPSLHRRYTKETGEDWHKIAHIPYLKITETITRESRHGGNMTMCNNIMPSCFSSYG